MMVVSDAALAGQVFLMFHNETKRALLPNEVTSLDTVRALFVRSFPHWLSMRWFDSPSHKIYILDRTSGIFYELDDLRSVVGRFSPILCVFLWSPFIWAGSREGRDPLPPP